MEKRTVTYKRLVHKGSNGVFQCHGCGRIAGVATYYKGSDFSCLCEECGKSRVKESRQAATH